MHRQVMYAYTARAGSSCQHIRASCRQCATTRLRSIAPRLVRQSSLLTPHLPSHTRSYSSANDPLAAWLESVRGKKRSEPQQLTPSSEAAPSKSADKSNSSRNVGNEGSQKHRKDGSMRGPGASKGSATTKSANKVKPQEEDLVHALKVIAKTLSKSKGRKLDESSLKAEPALADAIKIVQDKKPSKAPKKKGRSDPFSNTAKHSDLNTSVDELELASALGQQEPKSRKENGQRQRNNRRERRLKMRPEREQSAHAAGLEKDDSNSTLKNVLAAKSWLKDGQLSDAEKPLTPSKQSQELSPVQRLAEEMPPKPRKVVAKKMLTRRIGTKPTSETRKREASQLRKAKTPKNLPLIRSVVTRDAPDRDSHDSREPSRFKTTGPLLQKLYDITHSVATTQAQRLLLQFLEKNHDILGEHGEKLLEAQRDVAVFGKPGAGLGGKADEKLQLTLMDTFSTLKKALKMQPAKEADSIPETPLKGDAVGEISASELHLKPIDVPQPPVPGVVYGLDRVLFNPGVYQLRDEHSKVYNFDPYLETITPVKEFDFSALKEYITSSRDTALINIANQENTKYTGSTSSMTSVLAHFHYLLSKWRPLNMNHLSRGFPDPLTSFSAYQREPTGIFLRWRDGVYAIDANKEFDTANVLMYLGKSMEKFLTAERDVYEKFRKDQSHQLTAEEKDTPESYHYTTMGDFLMRSQLDAYDPRLPGTGMFDLKTRAVVSIRKDATDFEPGLGYEIRKRKGEFESFEREYYDLCRAAFMKYSLQARMGRMDGIFVAFHNIERIFGFQYLPIGAMDEAIHGTTDTTLGDQEFKVSVSMLNKVLDIFTAKFPEQSLQIDFETRPLNAKKDDCFMYIIAQPATEDKIKSIQETNLAKIQEYERKVVGLDSKQTAQFLIDEVNKETEEAELMDDAERLEKAIERPFEPHHVEILKAAVAKMNEHDTATENAVHKALEMVEQRLEEEGELVAPAESAQEPTEAAEESFTETPAEGSEETSAEISTEESAVDAAKEEKTTRAPKSPKLRPTSTKSPLMGLKIHIRNFVNDREVLRAENLTENDTWDVKYAIEEMKPAQALKRYEAMVARKYLVNVVRRKESLVGTRKGAGNLQQNQFLEAINDAVKAGKQYRAEQDREDERKGLTSLADKETFEPIKADEAEVRTGDLAVEDQPVEELKQAEEIIFTKEAQQVPKEEGAEPSVQEEAKVEEFEAEAEKPIEEFTPEPKEVMVEQTKEEAQPEPVTEEVKQEVKVEAEKPKKDEPKTEEKPWWLL